jgi:soluble lytic murein transglycosylase
MSFQSRYNFSSQQKGEVQQALAFASIKQNHPEAISWLKTVPEAHVSEELGELRLTFALERQDWRAIVDFTAHNPANAEDNLRWRYWHARGLEQTGQRAKAQDLYKVLAKERDYYGFLAANRINANYAMQNVPVTFTTTEEKQLLTNPSIQAAYEFYQLGMLKEGRIEWNHALNSLSPRYQAVATALADQWHWYDRAIATAAKAGLYDAVDIRFPLPYRVNLTTGARNQGIDLAWVYGIVRQESLFMADARSRSGALGLMQLMPASGRMVARQLGLKIGSNQDILDVNTNISLGTTYLRQMLERFDGNYMLATAAYNAGPGRAKRWSAERGCLPADVWVELIPFSETRTYVRRVLFYTAVFENQLGQQQHPIRIATTRVDCPFRQVNYR